MDLTIEISERDHASVMNALFTLMLKPSKVKLPSGYVKLNYTGLTENQVELIKDKAQEHWKLTITLNSKN